MELDTIIFPISANCALNQLSRMTLLHIDFEGTLQYMREENGDKGPIELLADCSGSNLIDFSNAKEPK